MTDYLFHEHRGKAHPFHQGADTALFGVWYTRWICSGCSDVVLLVKPESQQKVEVGYNGVVSVYGFALNEVVVDKKTGRKARVEKIQDVMVWRRVDGRNTRVASGEYEILTRWIEPDPAKPEGRILGGLWAYSREKFIRRFRKLETE